MYGPLHNEEAVEKFKSAVEDAKAQGGSVVYGGKVKKQSLKILKYLYSRIDFMQAYFQDLLNYYTGIKL